MLRSKWTDGLDFIRLRERPLRPVFSAVHSSNGQQLLYNLVNVYPWSGMLMEVCANAKFKIFKISHKRLLVSCSCKKCAEKLHNFQKKSCDLISSVRPSSHEFCRWLWQFLRHFYSKKTTGLLKFPRANMSPSAIRTFTDSLSLWKTSFIRCK